MPIERTSERSLIKWIKMFASARKICCAVHPLLVQWVNCSPPEHTQCVRVCGDCGISRRSVNLPDYLFSSRNGMTKKEKNDDKTSESKIDDCYAILCTTVLFLRWGAYGQKVNADYGKKMSIKQIYTRTRRRNFLQRKAKKNCRIGIRPSPPNKTSKDTPRTHM